MRLSGNSTNFFDDLEKGLQRLPDTLEEALGDTGSGAHRILVAAAWVVGGLGVITLGLLAGRELRGRYKLKRRTPYDYYAHSGDSSAGLDYSVGI